MIYLFESSLLHNKSIYFALTSVYGIGAKQSYFICKKLGFLINFKVKFLSEDQVNQIRRLCESLNLILANELKKVRLVAIKKLVFIKSYKGLRKKKGLPIRGQRTHTNAQTSRRVR